ncbi:MAG: chorismate mutase [Campylobacterales bacterium]|nr:chorismate mutase [Campylobacterales bacterium]
MKECKSLEEVRTEVDKIDNELVELISKRSHYIRQAAAFKESIAEVKTQDRIDYILSRVRHRAIELGVSPNMISELFEIMINEMVETEIAELRNRNKF